MSEQRDREPSLENRLFRLEERQRYIRDSLAEHKDYIGKVDAELRTHLSEAEKRLAEIDLKIQWLEWHQRQEQADRDQAKLLLPLAQRVAQVQSVDPSIIKMVIGALLSAVVGLALGEMAFFGGS